MSNHSQKQAQSPRHFKFSGVSAISAPLALTGLLAIAPLSAFANIGFSGQPQTVAETAGTALLTVVRDGTADSAASVSVLITHGTATEGSDFTGGTTTLSWGQGETGPRTVTITLLPDTTVEGSETVYFALTNVAGDSLAIGQDTTHLVISDNGGPVAQDPGLTHEQQTAGQVLDNLCASQNLPGSAGQSCSTFQQLNNAQQQTALESIMPRNAAQQTMASAQAQNGSTRAIQQRIQAVRTGSAQPGQTDLSGLRFLGNDGAVSLDAMLTTPSLRGGNAGDDGLLDSRWGGFVSGQIQMADQDSTTKMLGYQSTSQQITGGVDYRFSDKLFLGTALSLNSTNTDSNAHLGKQDSTVVVASIFGNYYFADSFYLDGMLSYGASNYDTKRKIWLGTITEPLASDTTGNQSGLALSIGYDKDMGPWQTNAYARAEINRFTIDGYREHGESGFALGIGNQATDSTQSALGGSVSYVKPFNFGVLIPKLTAEWVHEYNDDAEHISAYFLASPDSGHFIITTAQPDQDYFNVGWSVAGTFSQGRSAFIRYEAQVGRADYIAELVEIGGRIAF